MAAYADIRDPMALLYLYDVFILAVVAILDASSDSMRLDFVIAVIIIIRTKRLVVQTKSPTERLESR